MKYLLYVFLFFGGFSTMAQTKVGLVLSGGGASGMAHVGVLKALEENEIPVDYITGTSIGALIGGLYAAGYSPEEIEAMVTTQAFLDATNGIIDDQYKFYFKEHYEGASMVNWRFNLDSTFEANIPNSFVSSTPIDYGLMIYMSGADAKSNQNFDSLFIPFRCIASNITDRKEHVFRSGNLAAAIRASMTYPFYLAPIEVDGKIMFDGGLYNNFPANVLCEEFQPDFVIASNVTSRVIPPDEDNLLSQVKNMLIKEPNFEIKCAPGIIINSEVRDIATFEFEENQLAIQRGYNSANEMMDSIRNAIKVRRTKPELALARDEFLADVPELKFGSLSFKDYHVNQSRGFRKKVQPKGKSFGIGSLTQPYLSLASDEKIKSLYPTASFNPKTQLYDLEIRVKQEKDIRVSFGGVISSKPFSTGFFEIDYTDLSATELNFSGNIYFGRFYSSVQARGRWDLPFLFPFFIEGIFTINQFDYFNSQTTLIDDISPPYIINSERYAEGRIGFPIANKGRILLGENYFWQDFNYYQSNDFERGDTADITKFKGYSPFIKYQINSLNRKMYASKGGSLEFLFRYFDGKEKTTPGSTSSDKAIFKKRHNWFLARLNIEKYFFKKMNFRMGTAFELCYSDQPNFQNFTATLLNAPAFAPLPENKTIFQEQYRAFTFAGAGLKAIYSIRDHLDFRLEAYVFQPYNELNTNSLGQTKLGEEVADRDYIGTFTTVYHTPVGPLAASLNYYDDSQQELSFLIHFGYILFNKKSRE